MQQIRQVAKRAVKRRLALEHHQAACIPHLRGSLRD
jgi:hypothetical protein